MLRTKKDVDRHVQELFRKLKGENERKYKYFNVAKLYYQVGDYESSRRYISSFLSVRDDSASAHKLHGQALEALGQKENALAEYKSSLLLDNNQTELVLKVCELMSDNDSKLDKGLAAYWCERAEQLFPHHPFIFKLKEKLVSGRDENNVAELEKLILSELEARPKDVSLHVRLLRLYMESGRVKEAYNMAVEVEARFAFREELKWYECLSDVFEAYVEMSKPCGWEFYLDYTSILERAACLNLQEQYGSPRRSWAQGARALFSLDQILEVAANKTVPSSDATMYLEFLKHQRAQLCLHFATALFKKSKKEPSSWRDLSRAAAPLLLHALVPPPDLRAAWISQTTKTRRKSIEWWAKEAAFRNSQAGHIILSLLTERRSHFLERVTQFCCGNWRERLFQKMFNTRENLQCISSSHLVSHTDFAMPPLHLPTASDLRPHDEASQRLHPSSLHHLVWLGLRELNNRKSRGSIGHLGSDFRCVVFEDLQMSCSDSNVAGSETLCQLDIDAFLYASVLCAKVQEEQSFSSDRPPVLPANITDHLCTIAQGKWWTAAYRVYTNQARGDLGEIRQTLQRGLEVIRAIGNHGLDVRLVVQLARIFTERANAVTADQAVVEARAAMYWTVALPLLERSQRNQAVRAPNNRLFEYHGKELSQDEVADLVEEGHYFLACQLMKGEEHEKAMEAFQRLKSPYASFHQAMIYKKLAAQELQEQQGEHITSEMRSRHIILLTKVRECLYLTLDRLRSPGVDRKHPLNAELSSHIEEIESQLGRIDSDMWRGDVNRNDLEGMSDGSVSSGPSVGENGNSVYGLGNNYVHLTPRHINSSRFSSTPYRSSHNHRVDVDTGHERSRRTEARPSPERLEAQIRCLMHGRDVQMQQVLQQNKALLESHRNVADNLNKVANCLEELKNLIQELIKKDHKRSESQLNSDLPQVGDDDDIYVFDDDYTEEVSMPASHLGQYQPFPQYPSYAGAGYRQLSGMMGSNTVTYGPTPTAGTGENPTAVPPQPPPQLLPPAAAAGMSNFFRNVDPSLIYPQTLSYYGQGALPFSEGQQLPDFRAAPPAAGSVFSRLGAAVPPAAAAASAVGPDASAMHAGQPKQQPQAPVNVVITSSDTLPTTVPPTQPTLSVTIPPQHLLGTPLVHPAVPPPVAAALPQAGIPPVGPPIVPAGVVAPVVPAAGMGFPGVPPAQLQNPLQGGQLGLGTGLAPAPAPLTAVSSAGTVPSTVPHAFQISMPPQAQVPVASRLEKGAAALSPVLPISTQTLLSSVPSPVYSAVGFDKPGKDQPTTPVSSPPTGSVPPKPSKAHRVSTGSGVSEDGAAEEPEHDPCPDYQPVIPLPAEVEVTTGEEQEVKLYECRCKLFRFVDKEWKERGVGHLKMLHHKETGKVRVLMRREQVLKVCANHFLTPDMSLTRMSDKAWMWAANDFADEQVRLEKLCVRFKTQDDADNFADAFNHACELSRNAKVTPVKDSKKQGGAPTPPSTQAASTLTPTTSPSEKFTLGGFSFIAPPKFNPAKKEETEKEVVKKEKDKAGATTPKTSPFAMFSFSANKTASSEPKPPATSIVSTPTVSSASEPTDLRKLQTPTLGSTPSLGSQTSKEKAAQKDPAGGGEPLMFKAASNLTTFSTLATASPKEPTFGKNTPFKGFEGAGTPLFASASTPASGSQKKETGTPKATGGGDEEGQEDFVPTQEFAPVIPLPELVEVKTGEEGEEIVFQERAKLLRFDGDIRQWKERGVGSFKILKDPQTGRIRFLMRREQVLKVCCNHTLTAALSFTALQTSDRAWTWYAQDFSEGEVKPELLALKFKTVEQAQAFGAKVKELQSLMVGDKVPVTGDVAGSGTKSTVAATVDSSPATVTAALALTSLSETASDPEWKCSKCFCLNTEDSNMCCKCNAAKPRPRSEPGAPGDKLKLSEMFKPPAGSWECANCYARNTSGHDHCVCCMEIRAVKSPPKPKQGMWECKTCYTRNGETDRMCSSCESERPLASSVTPTKQNGPANLKPLSEMFKPKAGSWECQGCLVRNDASAIQCPACSTPKPGHEDAVKKKDTQAQSQPFTFSFGIPKQADSGKDAPGEKPKPELGFSFGMPATTAQQTVFGAWSFGTTTISTTATTSATTSLTFGTPSITSTSAPDQSAVISSTTSGVSGVKAEPEKGFSFEAKPAPFQFGTQASATKPFSFGVKETTAKKEETTPEAEPRNFVFGSPQSFEFSFSGIRPKSPVKSPKSPGVVGTSGGEDESGSEPEEDEGEHIFFQPVIPLPEKVPLHTGEEEEDVLYSHRAKLFRFVEGAWKERGVGDIKILQHRETRKIRLVMRREQVLKLCLNHFLSADMVFCQKDEKSWLWSAPDFAEGEIQQEQLAIRFQNKDIATAFKEAVDKAQASLGSPSKADETDAAAEDTTAAQAKEPSGDGGSVTEGLKSLTFAGSKSCTPPATPLGPKGVVRSLFGSPETKPSEDDVQVVYEFSVSAEERAQALRLMLPPNFYEYRRKPACPGCCGCEPDSDTEEGRSCSRTEGSQAAVPSSAPPMASLFSAPSLVLAPTTQPSTLVFTTPTTTVSSAPAPPTTTLFFGQTTITPQSKGLSFSSGASQAPKNLFGTPNTTPVTSAPTSQSKAFSSFSFAPSENKDIKPSLFATTAPHVPSNTSATGTTSVFGSQGGALFSGPRSTTSSPSIFGGTSSGAGQSTPSLIGPNPPSLFGQKNVSIFGQGATSKPETSIFGGATTTASATPVFGLPTTTAPSATSASSLFSQKPSFNFSSKTPSFHMPQDNKPSQSALPAQPEKDVQASQPQPKEETEEGVPFLPTDSSLTFTSLASQKKQAPFLQATDTSKTFTWADAGAKVFGVEATPAKSMTPKESSKKGTPKSGGEGSSDEEEGGADHDPHDPHFEPIVALPDAIEVRTGEEDEEKVFCQRAKLFRYETDLHEWKERGVGEMKILKHPARGTYRFLLRREQVHKVVLNQRLTPALTLGPLAASELAWCWAGLNFAEDEASGELRQEPKLEKLAVRFKNKDLALQFEECVKQCVAQLAAQPASPAAVHLNSSAEDSEEDREKHEEEDNEDEEEEEEDEDDDEERNYLFEKRATLEAHEPDSEAWTLQGMGVLQIIYDHSYLLARIYMEADNSHDVLCNTLIAMDNEVEVRSKDCIWTAKDYANDPAVVRTFKARFSSETAAGEFRNIFDVGKKMAAKQEFLDHMDPSEL